MDPVWIAVAFVFGHMVRFVGLPPLVGFLAAGFVLWAFDVEGGETLDKIADVGVYLLLFGIGLKLKLRSLLRPEILGVATIHMLGTTVFFGGVFFLVGLLGVGLTGGMSLFNAAIIGFALSFSSTIFAVKILEERGESSALHGRVAIGILILQDILAVIFLTASLGKVPSPWALCLLALPLIRPPLLWIMTRSGHGELLVLFGVLFVFLSTNIFQYVGLKPDLGAIVFGMLIGSHPKANELSNVLMGFKDLFLVGFFLTVGLKGMPSLGGFGIAVVLTMLIPLKMGLFFYLMSRFKLRIRTSLLGSLSLANYSEFGLIVGAVATANGWLADEWLVILAVALALSFIVAAPFNSRAHSLYERIGSRLRRFEKTERIPGDELIDPGEATIIIFGMGRVGSGAYDELRRRLGDVILGVDRKLETVRRHGEAGRNVVLGDATDVDFYKKMRTDTTSVQVVMLAMSNHLAILAAAEIIRKTGFKGRIAATARYPEQIDELKSAGVQAAFDVLAEAGSGFADEVCDQLDPGPSGAAPSSDTK